MNDGYPSPPNESGLMIHSARQFRCGGASFDPLPPNGPTPPPGQGAFGSFGNM
jgi:hypothetical protein